MTQNEIQHIINKGEGLTVEFKTAKNQLPQNLFETVCAFLNAALLLFGKEDIIQGTIPHYKIDAVLRRENLNRYDDRENICCNLIDAYDILMNFVAKHLPDKFYLEGDLRISLREKIFREIIANLLMHREYSNASPATLVIYKNKVVVKNANRARLHGMLIPGEFEPFSKNPAIAKFFVQMAFAEDLGTGINNVYRFLKPYAGTKPVFKEEDTFIVEIPLLEKVPDKVPDNLTNNQSGILRLIQANSKISMSQMAKEIGISKRKILDNINKLGDKNIVKRVGNTKSGHWEILKDTK